MATEKEIHAAADAITAEGGNPTLAAIRERVGGGSYTTISQAMQRWRAMRAAQQPAEASTPPLPAELAEHINAWWEGAIVIARREFEAERAALTGERQELERQRAEAAELADQLAGELDEARAQLVRLEGADRRLAEIKAEAAQALDEAAGYKVRAALAWESREAEAGKAEQYRKEAERYRMGEQNCQARLETAAREMEDLRQRAKEAEARALKAAEEAAELRGRLVGVPDKRGKKSKLEAGN